MKSIKIFATVGAIALLGMTGLTSCNQKNTPVGPENLKEGEVVKTEFTISIPEVVGGASTARYMPGSTVQSAENKASFRGISNIVLIPYAVNEGSPATPKRAGVNITLRNTPNDNTLNSTDINDKGAKVYTDVSIPIGTSHFLFYGEATPGTGTNTVAGTPAYKHEYGLLTANDVEDAPGDISFSLNQINTNTAPAQGAALVAYLNRILASEDAQATPVAWEDYATTSALYSIYSLFTQLKTGSSASIERAILDMAKLLQSYENTGADVNGLVAKIFANIEGTSNADGTLTITGSGLDKTVTNFELADTHKGYPNSIGLPDGAASIKYNGDTKEFELLSTTNANGMSLNSNEAATYHGLTSFVYPPSLYYFVNSPLRVSNASQAAHYTENDKEWADFLTAYYSASDGEVTFVTRSVAITNQIQYAVGRMDLRVGVTSSPLYYNDPQKDDATPGNSSIALSAGLPVTAVLIGGQRKVDWEFIPISTETPFTIYDNAVPDGFNAPVGGMSSATNYTLALETAASEKVRFALELTNNTGKDFYNNADELVPAGATFYLVGELDPVGAGATNGTATGNRVFKQDYKTIVTVTLPNDCLKRAYNTLPDMRATKLELGLSVNLQWQEGMSFTVQL